MTECNQRNGGVHGLFVASCGRRSQRDGKSIETSQLAFKVRQRDLYCHDLWASF